MMLEVMQEGKTLAQCEQENPLLFSKNMDKLKKLRMQYISNAKPPKTRINYYISGRGGLGKGLASRALARSLFPDIKNDDELFHVVGADGATFEEYDGQPVIIGDDCRSFEMLQILKTRGNVFNVLDTHPVKKRQNIKYGSINLINTVNIINSVQSYKDFLDGLAGEYTKSTGERIVQEDKGQAYRRIPFIINLHEEDFDLLVNKGFIENTKNFGEFIEYKNIVGNFEKVRVTLEHNEELAMQIEDKMLRLPKQQYDAVMETAKKVENEEELLKQLENYGKTKSQVFSEKEEQGYQEWEQEIQDTLQEPIPKYDLFD